MIDFSYSIIKEGKIDLTHTKLRHHNTKTKINLIGADLDKITLNYADFKLYFPKYTSHDLKVQTYNKLLNHFASTQDKKVIIFSI